MSCQWNSQDSNRVRVQWRKQASSTEEANGTLLCSVLGTESSNHSEVRNNTKTCSVAYNTSLLTIAEVTMDDGGLYVCDVTKEIPRLKRAKGNGTQVLVYVPGENSGTSQYKPLIAIALIPIVALGVYFLCKRKKEKSKKIPPRKKQEHIELNQMHQDVAVVEEEDSNSSNSVQWAVSTLYESFDYFAMKVPAASSSDNLSRPETTEKSSLTDM
ncbi:uncharacterized protein RB166_001526 [Leptodactylus fuscus]